MKRFESDRKSEFIDLYNKLINDVESGERTFVGVPLQRHHIIPKSVRPDLEHDEDNLINLPVYEHTLMHYWLWKHDRIYAPQFWFCLNYARKNGMLNISHHEYEQLRKDMLIKKRHKTC